MPASARYFMPVMFLLIFISTVACDKEHGKISEDAGGPVAVSARVDRDSITIGDKIKYIIEVKADEDIEIEPPVIDGGLTGFAVRDFGSQESGLIGKKTTTYWFLLDTYETGKHTIPETTLKYRKKGTEKWQELTVNKVEIEVKSVLGDETEKADIKDIKGPVSFPNRLYLYVFAGTVASLAIAAVIFFILRRKKETGETFIPPQPAHEIAYKALKELQKKDYLKTGRIENYYIELSDIVRRYLENRFHLRAPEMTTEEFLLNVKDSRELNSEQKGLLTDFLSHCDLVKFARYRPGTVEIDKSYESAKRLVDQTKLLPSAEATVMSNERGAKT